MGGEISKNEAPEHSPTNPTEEQVITRIKEDTVQTVKREGTIFNRRGTITEEKVMKTHHAICHVQEAIREADLEDIQLDVTKGGESENVAQYCLPLFVLHFCGQTSRLNDENADVEDESTRKILNMKNYLRMFDKYLRQHEKVTDFTGEEDEYKMILRLIANKRYRKNEETVDECFQRLLNDSKRFVKIYHTRGMESESLLTKDYWASRQQLLAGKVIADWIDKDNGPLDPIFGVMLQPTAGRVGPGDSGWIHNMLFDDRGEMAYHSAVHDAFGYLINTHKIGPGYDYLNESIIDTNNPMAGQFDGIEFWTDVINKIQEKGKILNHFRC